MIAIIERLAESVSEISEACMMRGSVKTMKVVKIVDVRPVEAIFSKVWPNSISKHQHRRFYGEILMCFLKIILWLMTK